MECDSLALVSIPSTHASTPNRVSSYTRRPPLVKPTAVCCSSAAVGTAISERRRLTVNVFNCPQSVIAFPSRPRSSSLLQPTPHSACQLSELT